MFLIWYFCSNISADKARNRSVQIRNETVKLIRDREDTTTTNQRDADRRIGERLHDVSQWRAELRVYQFFSFVIHSN